MAVALAVGVVACPAREVTVVWNPQTDADSFRVETKAADGTWTAVGTTTTAEYKGQFPDDTFDLRIVALAGTPNARMESDPSDVLRVMKTPGKPGGVKVVVTVAVTVTP